MTCHEPEMSSAFIQTTTEVHGEAGTQWLKYLPELLAECAVRWSLTVGSPFVPLSDNYVAQARRADGTPVVLKAGVPARELTTEIEALRLFDGRGAVRLLEADADAGILLLEHVMPGTPLASISDDSKATEITAEVMQKLWRPVTAMHPFPTIEDWTQGFQRLRHRFDGRTGPLPPGLVEEAETTCADLLVSPPGAVLLHGDLHHGNILTAERAPWLAIDPKGVIGEPAFEPSAFLLNPGPRSKAVLKRRVEIFADVLGVPRERVRRWGLVRAVLSAWWSVEDHGTGGNDAVAVAERLSALAF
jgi:streptomycin 6-kinase